MYCFPQAFGFLLTIIWQKNRRRKPSGYRWDRQRRTKWSTKWFANQPKRFPHASTRISDADRKHFDCSTTSKWKLDVSQEFRSASWNLPRLVLLRLLRSADLRPELQRSRIERFPIFVFSSVCDNLTLWSSTCPSCHADWVYPFSPRYRSSCQ